MQERVTVAQEEEQSSANGKVGGFTPSFPEPHVEVSLGKTPNTTLPPDASIGVCMCVKEETSTV